MAEERKYRIRVDGILVDVSKEVYHAYYSIERHTRTLDEKDTRNGKVLYSELGTEEVLGEEMRGAAELRVPLSADVNSGTTWYAAKG